MVKNFNAHKYTVTDCTDKEFVGNNIKRDADFNYYMDQTRMITEIIKEAKLTGAEDERLPYTIGNDPIPKVDSATEEQKFEMSCQSDPWKIFSKAAELPWRRQNSSINRTAPTARQGWTRSARRRKRELTNTKNF